MKALAIIMLVLAILLGAVGGVAYAISWWVVPENTEFIALFTEQNIVKDGRELRPAESMVEIAETYLTTPVVIGIFAAAAVLIVLAIVLLIAAGARKKAKRRKAARAFEAEEAPVEMPVAAAPVMASAPTVAPAQTRPAVALSDDKKELLKKVVPIAIAGAAVVAVILLVKKSSSKR